MAVSAAIVKRPILTSSESPATKFRWVAAWNPIAYVFTITGATDPTTYLNIQVYEYGSNRLLASDNYSVRNQSLTIDISGIISSYLYSIYNPLYRPTINCKDHGSTIKAYIKYSVNTSTVTGALVSDESNFIYVTNSAKQPLDLYGQSMREYTPTGQEGNEAKFLTKFDQPVMFIGFPFNISWIFSELIMGHELQLVSEMLNINKVIQTDSEASLSVTQVHFINYLKLDYSDEPSTINYVDIYIKTGALSPDVYVYPGYVEDGYTEVR